MFSENTHSHPPLQSLLSVIFSLSSFFLILFDLLPLMTNHALVSLWINVVRSIKCLCMIFYFNKVKVIHKCTLRPGFLSIIPTEILSIPTKILSTSLWRTTSQLNIINSKQVSKAAEVVDFLSISQKQYVISDIILSANGKHKMLV